MMSVKKRFKQFKLPSDVMDTKNGKLYHTMTGNDGYDLCLLLNELHEENQSLKEEKIFLQNKIEIYKSVNVVLKKTLEKELEE